MLFEELSSCKINLTLRVTSIRDDGFHDLVSVFWKIPRVEKLTIRELTSNNVKDNIICHNFSISGKNILENVLHKVRDQGWEIPPLEIQIFKEIPPGTGLGAGSGNAAALLDWLQKKYGTNISPEIIREIGADVSFLNSNYSCALIRGIGDDLVPVPAKPGLIFMVFIPEWTSATAQSYMKIDEWYKKEGFPLQEGDALKEAGEIISLLNAGRRYGCLPNDFHPVLVKEWPQYSCLFDFLEQTDALAWGITGSGSASFAIFENDYGNNFESCIKTLNSFKWLRKIFLWSDDR